MRMLASASVAETESCPNGGMHIEKIMWTSSRNTGRRLVTCGHDGGWQKRFVLSSEGRQRQIGKEKRAIRLPPA